MKERLNEIKLILAEVMPDIRAEKVVVYAIDEVYLLEGDNECRQNYWSSRKGEKKTAIARTGSSCFKSY
ncbi:hypothetical protein [Coleofasciculus sp. F4-SAH-05]|uniref:hypothetical protein n=1 Tax=Coleofasciculus sp. F4-SAH-05 TaxID=3069525 RepID=UPI0032FD1665